MKNYKMIISIISIIVCIIVCIFLFNQNANFIKVGCDNVEQEIVPNCIANFLKNFIISIIPGVAIYIVFYGIPHEYKIVNKKN